MPAASRSRRSTPEVGGGIASQAFKGSPIAVPLSRAAYLPIPASQSSPVSSLTSRPTQARADVTSTSRGSPPARSSGVSLSPNGPSFLKSAGPALQPPLPRRMPRQVQVRPVVVMNDPDILRRIRDGFRDLSDCWAGLLSSRVDSQGETLRITTHRSGDGQWDAMIVYAASIHGEEELFTHGTEGSDPAYR